MKERWVSLLILAVLVQEGAFARDLPAQVLDHCRSSNLKMATLAAEEHERQIEFLLRRTKEIALLSGEWILDHPEVRASYFGLRVLTGLLVRKKFSAVMYRKVGETLSKSIASTGPELLKWADVAPRTVSMSTLEIQAQLEARLAQILTKTESKLVRDEIALQVESNLSRIFGAAQVEALEAEAGAIARSMSKEFTKIPELKTGTLSETVLKDTAKVAKKGVWKIRVATGFTYLSGALLLEAILQLFSSARSNPEYEWFQLVDRYPDALLNPELMNDAEITVPGEDPMQVHCYTLTHHKEKMEEVMSRIPRRLNYLFRQELKALQTNEL